MPFNGSGGFDPLPPPIYPAIDGTTIESAQYNDSLDDIFGGLGNCVTRDGQSPATADLPMGANTIVGARDAVIAGEPLIFGQSGAELADLEVSGALTVAGSPVLTVASPGAYLPLAGGTLTGDLTLDGAVEPQVLFHVASALKGRLSATSTVFALGADAILELRTAGSARLSIDAAGALSFGGTLAGNGSLLTALNATQLTSGTVPTARIASVASGTTMDSKVLGYKGLPAASVTTGAFAAADAGKCVYATGGVTVPDAIMSAEDTVVIQNTTASPIAITATITTLRWTTSGGVGNRTLAAYGRCSIVFGSGTLGYIAGDLT